jgi:hypothetical protein
MPSIHSDCNNKRGPSPIEGFIMKKIILAVYSLFLIPSVSAQNWVPDLGKQSGKRL